MSLENFIGVIRTVYAGYHPSKVLFFRGVNSANFELLPSVYRRDFAEPELTHNFRSRAKEGPNYDEYDKWLFLMQHHGLPTRLLDWSESPLVALHFALYEQLEGEDAIVHILDPTSLNEKILGGKWHPDRHDPNYKYRFIKAFYRSPEKLPWDLNDHIKGVRERKLPLAIQPVLSHQRMVSQQAAFTLHGDDTRDMVKVFQAHGMDHVYSKIIIPNECKDTLQFDLLKCGISRAVIFPDLEGIAADIVSKSEPELRSLRKF